MLNFWTSTMAILGSFFSAYWPLVIVGLILVAYYVLNRQRVKKVLLQFMIQVEKRAAELALATGADKMQFVIDKAFVLLPKPVQWLFPKSVLTGIAQSVYDEAKTFLNKITTQPVATVVPDATIDQLANYMFPKLLDALATKMQTQPPGSDQTAEATPADTTQQVQGQ